MRIADDATVTRTIHDLDYVTCLPVVAEVGEYAAELRAKYYENGTGELSYVDAIHLATATVHDECDALYTGNDDFAGVEEVETVVL